MKNIKFKTDQNDFVSDLRNKVNAYFIGKNRKGSISLYFKTTLLFVLLIMFHILSLWYGNIFVFIILGIVVALIGFNVMHDASHGSYSNNKKLNNILIFVAADVMGGASRFWDEKHNNLHHTFTNIVSVDDDIGKTPMFRLVPSHEYRWFHRYQHLYCWFIYCFTTIYWFYIDDFVVYKTQKISGKSFSMNDKEKKIFWIGKIIHITLFIILPFLLLGFSWWTLCYLLIMHASASLFLAIVFQMAHVVEITEFYDVDDELDSWHVHEILTTADFATGSKFWSYLLGGLNFQVEHHLFRDVSHIHYPALHRIVREECEHYGISYKEFPSFGLAIVSHYRYLRQMGQKN